MAFTGYLSQFSLPELFRFLEEGYKTGLLTISNLIYSNLTASKLHSKLTTGTHYIWLQQGRILAAAESLDNQCLISILTKRGWNKDFLTLKDFENSSSKTTMGLYLKSQGTVKAEQLMLLFRAQVTEKISPLFELKNAEFNFEVNAPLPLAEMTGLSIPATEATLMGLRNLEEWSQLQGKLPDRTSSILAKTQERPKIRLEYTESQVWKYANGNLSMQKISEQLQLPLEKVQQIAFRLIVSNLAEEVFILQDANKTSKLQDANKTSKLQDANKTSNLQDANKTSNLQDVNKTSNLQDTNKTSNLQDANKTSNLQDANKTDNTTKAFPELESSNKVLEKKVLEKKITELNSHQKTKNLATMSSSKLSQNSKNCEQESSSVASSTLEPEIDAVPKTNMSQSFLQNLVGFLQNKIDN